MNRTDFMNQLESLLQNISPTEREEAIQYYNEYFNDAGVENEQSVIEALGNPAKVAENIKRDLYGEGYGETVFQKNIPNDRAMVKYQQASQENTDKMHVSTEVKKNKMSTGMIVLIIVLCILASPIILGLGSGIIGTLIGIIAAWFAVIVGVGMVAIVLLIVMVVLAVVGVMCMFTDVLVGVAMLGGGLVCGGIGLLFLMLTVALAGIVTPAICRGIVSLFRMIFGKKRTFYARLCNCSCSVDCTRFGNDIHCR